MRDLPSLGKNALVRFRPLLDLPNVEVRLHGTVLYNSIFVADDHILVNPHVYGLPASDAPVLHIRRAEDLGMAATYLKSFEDVWETAVRAG